MIGALLAISEGAWAAIAALITGLFGVIAELLRRTLREVRQVNRAVNHVAPGEPPLIERVRRLEQRTDMQSQWMADVLELVAAQLGVKLPPHPEANR